MRGEDKTQLGGFAFEVRQFSLPVLLFICVRPNVQIGNLMLEHVIHQRAKLRTSAVSGLNFGAWVESYLKLARHSAHPFLGWGNARGGRDGS